MDQSWPRNRAANIEASIIMTYHIEAININFVPWKRRKRMIVQRLIGEHLESHSASCGTIYSLHASYPQTVLYATAIAVYLTPPYLNLCERSKFDNDPDIFNSIFLRRRSGGDGLNLDLGQRGTLAAKISLPGVRVLCVVVRNG